MKVTSHDPFLARDVIYTSHAYAMMSVSVCPFVCEGSALWSRCMPGRGEGSACAMLATARPSCKYFGPHSGMAEARIVKFCTQVGYIKSQQTDDKSPLNEALLRHMTHLNF